MYLIVHRLGLAVIFLVVVFVLLVVFNGSRLRILLLIITDLSDHDLRLRVLRLVLLLQLRRRAAR